MSVSVKKQKWGKRTFTARQWLRRDLASAATLAKKNKRQPSMPKFKCLEDK